MPTHETITILGASGTAGSALLEQALERGYRVRALVRRPRTLEKREGLEIIHGDATDADDVLRALEGADAVISTIGPRRTRNDSGVCASATCNVLEAMQQLGIRRYVVMSGGAIELPGDERKLLGKFMKFMIGTFGGDLVTDKKAEVRVLLNSELDWTLVRAPMLVPGAPNDAFEVNDKTPTAMKVTKGNLARHLLDQLDDERHLRAGVFVAN